MTAVASWVVDHTLTAQDLDLAYRWLSEESDWSKGLPRDVFDRAVEGSLCFALRDSDGVLRGFARAITDKATFAYLCDVFIDSAVRGRGGGRTLVREIMAHPELQHLRRWLLVTRDAHRLYAPFGFTALSEAGRFMQRHDPDVYRRPGIGP